VCPAMAVTANTVQRMDFFDVFICLYARLPCSREGFNDCGLAAFGL
jgi:hypothetical protein